MTYVVDSYDHKKIMIVAFITVPLRMFLFAILVEFFDNPWALTCTQIIEGIGAGVYDLLIPIIVQQMTKGSGRFGFTFGFICAMWRIGHGCSVFLGELIVHEYSYLVAFISLGVIGMINLLVFVLFFKFDDESGREAAGGNEKVEEEDGVARLSPLPDDDFGSGRRQQLMRRASATNSSMLMNSATSQRLLGRSSGLSGSEASRRVSFVSAGSSSAFFVVDENIN